MQTYKLNQSIIDFTTGKPYVRQIVVDLTVLDVIVGALMAPDNNALHSPAEREARLNLAERLVYEVKGAALMLSEEEVALIRKACALVTPTQFYGWVMRALEPPATHQ
jgi:hypothetical protein